MSRSASGQKWRGKTSSERANQEHGWRGGGGNVAALPVRSPRSIYKKLLLLGMLVTITAIVIVIYLLWPKKPARFFLFGESYAQNLLLPHNIHGMRGLARISDVIKSLPPPRWSGKTTIHRDGPQSLPSDANISDLDGFIKDAPENLLVLVLSGNGATDNEGSYLFCDSDKRLHLKKLFEVLGKEDHREKQLLVFLDVHPLQNEWNLGILRNTFVRDLKHLIKEKYENAPNLFVVCSCDEEEVAYSSDEMQQSVFLNWLAEGLAGAAADDTNEVHADNLIRFVMKETKEWVDRNRKEVQTPIWLPKVAGIEERAAKITLMLSQKRGKEPPKPAKLDLAATPWTEEWTKYRDLAHANPHPSVYHPRRWRRYRESLLRLEEVIRAGDPAAADFWKSQLVNLHREISETQTMYAGLPIRTNGLPEGAALSIEIPKDLDALQRRIRDILNKPSEESAENWQLLVTEVGEAKLDALQILAVNQLLDDFQGSSREELIRIKERMGTILTGREYPTEAHLVLMLHEFFVVGNRPLPAPGLLRLAVETRRLSEAASYGTTGNLAGDNPKKKNRFRHPYSEWLPLELREAINAADMDRRFGEDLLFSDTDSAPAASATALRKAKAAYEKILEEFAPMRHALALRDRVFADLPWLSRALIRQPIDEADQNELVELRKLAVSLWQDAHELADKLSLLDPISVRPGEATKYLTGDEYKKIAKSLPEGMDRLLKHVRTIAGRASTESRGQENLVRIEMALQFPLWEEDLGPGNLSVERRRELIELGRSITTKLYVEDKGSADTPLRKVTAFELAREEGRLLAAALGVERSRFNTDIYDTRKGKTANLKPPTEIRANLEKAKIDDPTQTDSLVAAGIILDLYQRELETILDTRETLAASLSDTSERWALVSADLRKAQTETRSEPAITGRARRWQRMLVWLGERCGLDHWYTDPDRAFSLEAAKNALASADMIGTGKYIRPDQNNYTPPSLNYEQVKQLIDLPKITFKGSDDPRPVTDQQELKCAFKIGNFDERLKGGRMVVWFTDVKQSPFEVKRGENYQKRIDYDPLRKSIDVDLVKKPTTTAEVMAARIEVLGEFWFRGQRLPTPQKAALGTPDIPDLVVREFAPNPNDKPRIAFRAAQELNIGQLVIVFDASGSMFEEDTKIDGKYRYDQALEVLRQVLVTLPAKTPITLRILGHRFDKEAWEALVKEGKDKLRGAQAKVTRDEVVPGLDADNIGWHTEERIDESLRKLKAMQDRDESGKKRIGYATPLVRAMVNAVQRNFDNSDLPKTLLLLTDGEDTEHDRETIRRLLLSEIAESKVLVQMLLFQSTIEDEKKIRDQFGLIEDETAFKKPGKIWTPKDQTELRDRIQEALRPRLQLYNANGQRRLLGRDGLKATNPIEPLRTIELSQEQLDPALYDALTHAVNKRQPVSLNPGDRLLMKLTKGTNNKVLFERELLGLVRDFQNTDEHPRIPIKPESQPWMLTRLAYGTQDAAGLRALVAFEETRSRLVTEDSTLRQVWPRFTWWELQAVGSEKPAKMIEIDNLFGYAAPVWSLYVQRGWPTIANQAAPAEARLRVWTSGDAPPPPLGEKFVVTDDGRITPQSYTHYGDRNEANPRGIRVSLREEEVPISGSSTDKVKKPCLIISFDYPPQHEVIARVVDGQIQLAGSEHRFFAGANSYSGRFWPVRLEQLQAKPLSIELIDLKRFKTSAETDGKTGQGRGTFIEMNLPSATTRYRHLTPLQ